ncbi:pectin lyase-like protein [Exidia glandulosa HHB12029]|uniref:Pectin lyase-like protein n=1 Tax=Exidia glandulosa HHB12029 TaxID=1314781 RepID=A0A165NGS7_EXIGL|nr:pectin lyase-like protein [Exidia glandulosa HHB12029]
MPTVSFAYNYEYAHFSMDYGQEIEIRVRPKLKNKIDKYRISPENLPIKAKIEGKELVFKMSKPHYLIVKLDNEMEFAILADPQEKNVPKLGASNVFNVLDYKADNTGKAITTGVQDAMDAAAKKPGSIVYVPPGLYYIGNLILRNQTSLYLAGGSVLRMTGKPADYRKMYTKSDLGPGTWWIYTEPNSQDIKVYGRGILDGNGKTLRTNNRYIASVLVPSGTKNFTFDGPIVRDSAFWAVNVVQIQDSLFTNLKVLDRFDVTQNDGIDINESQRVTVKRAIAIANDDSFSTKTWAYNDGTSVPYPYKPRPNKDILFDDCLAWTRCYGYKVGQGAWEAQDNITFQNSVVYYAGVGVGVHHKFGSDTLSDIHFKNIDIESIGGSPGGQAAWAVLWVQDVGKGNGAVRGVTLENIRTHKLGAKKAIVSGNTTDASISDVTFRKISIGDKYKLATSLEEMNIQTNQFANNVRIVN